MGCELQKLVQVFEQVMSGNADTDSETDDNSGADCNLDQKFDSENAGGDSLLTEAERRRRKARIQRKKQPRNT